MMVRCWTSAIHIQITYLSYTAFIVFTLLVVYALKACGCILASEHGGHLALSVYQSNIDAVSVQAAQYIHTSECF